MASVLKIAGSFHISPSTAAFGRDSIRAFLLGLLLLVAAALPGFAQNYPALSGRVVDEAGIIPAETKISLDLKLSDLETKSGIQIVVATVKSLDGGDIETYANGLFRKWQLGEKTKNNGVLLLVAPNDRRVRIEVGYGLEGTLTDALSKVIITNAVTPRFKTSDFGGGIERGVDDIITVLTTDSSEWQKRPELRLDSGEGDSGNVIVAGAVIILILLLIVSPGFRFVFFEIVLRILASSGSSGGSSSGSWSSGGSSSGGFSGGGGSSGGGGASGSW